MSIKSFTTGEVLTAADTNTYLANSGLVYVTQQSFGGATALNIDNCFTTSFTHYLIQINVVPSASCTMHYLLRSSGTTNAANNTVTTGFYQTTGVATLNGDTQAAATYAKLAFNENDYGGAINLWLFNPQTATTTFGYATSNSNNFPSTYNFIHKTSSQYDGIRFTSSTGTITFNGQVRIYGSRQS
jgi:hypothetical protein